MTDHKWPNDALVASKRIVESMGCGSLTFLGVGARHGETGSMLWVSSEIAQRFGNF